MRVAQGSSERVPGAGAITVVSLSTSCWGAEESLLTLAENATATVRLVAPAGALLERAAQMGLGTHELTDAAVLRMSRVGSEVSSKALPAAVLQAARGLARAPGIWDSADGRPDAVVSFSQWLHLPLALAGRMRRSRVVLDLHDGPFTRAGASIQSSAAWSAAGVVSVSETALRHVRSWPAGRTTVVARPVSLPAEVLDGPVASAETGRPLSLVIVGRLDPEKRVELALQTHAALVADGVPVTLDVVGDTHATQGGAHLPAAYPHARFHGRLGRIETLTRIRESDVLLSLAPGEAFGRTVAEAALLGVPALVVDSGGPAELVRHGETGWVIPAEDGAALEGAVRMLVQDRGVLPAAGSAARELLAPRCDPARVADHWQAAVLGHGVVKGTG